MSRTPNVCVVFQKTVFFTLREHLGKCTGSAIQVFLGTNSSFNKTKRDPKNKVGTGDATG